jgi:hypothetical protein
LEKHGAATQATDNTTMWLLRFDCQINKARIQTLKIPITILLENCNNDCIIVPQCYLSYLSCFLLTGTARPAVGTVQPPVGGHLREKVAVVKK